MRCKLWYKLFVKLFRVLFNVCFAHVMSSCKICFTQRFVLGSVSGIERTLLFSGDGSWPCVATRRDACCTHVEHSTINVGRNARAVALSPVVYGLLQPI